MLDFMVLSLPRSGSTWASNWLSTEQVNCVHDPLYSTHFRDFDGALTINGKVSGVACTGTGWLWPEWVNDHPARKLVLRRQQAEAAASLRRIGWAEMPWNAEAKLARVQGWHVAFTDLFDAEKAAKIWKYLTGKPFDAERHHRLTQMRIEPKLDRLTVNREVEARLIEEIG